MRIGIDVGGTNTDAVLMDGSKVVSACKSPTSSDVRGGIIRSLRTLLDTSKVERSAIDYAVIGTTHFTNAFVQARDLNPVATIRLGAPATMALPPFSGWPAAMRSAIEGVTAIIGGGNQFDGREITPLDEKALVGIAREIKAKGLTAAAICSVYSPTNAAFELRAAEILQNELPELGISLSHRIGRIGLLEREAATIMNASLLTLADHVVDSFKQAFVEMDLDVPFYVSQNDGTILSAAAVSKTPVLTFASGPTNSMRGAALLSGLSDAIVIDIGGTTSDIGVIHSGYPRESNIPVDIGGVRTNFRMPDMMSIGLGGGSLVSVEGDMVSVGPRSVGYRLIEDGLVFGGATLTATDIAVASGLADVGDVSLVRHLDKTMLQRARNAIRRLLEDGIDRMKSSSHEVPVVLVGGGAILVEGDLHGAADIVRLDHGGVANAVGAALAQVGGEVDQIYVYSQVGRDNALQGARELARSRAIEAGADERTLEIVEVDEVPIDYVPGQAVRVRVKAAGDLVAGGVQ
ncbi:MULTISPECIES: hydantoinase/oxoprolinase N-terminal domain-containing protein [unclassified Sphingomonas]|uniref:hydantoinase/oxoprolinase N-terminal domain-containing protein n=1 Tax=unclassified Sphingomonas TaxID=196159 RepID=UPI0006FCF18D|nr:MULTISPECIES: hydantoinase/oxoprolinase family protein [unclassified Sphingomonas]KQX23418.1 hydantoinase subunit beta [Sphingomonas sp. Root1294]KQY68269.1 hydantoinase subunit beta [Sphingomonas sp. Root50]KRB91168.1 hydantoinase subunit beta [Sphingomonas sp. Root720]